MIKKLLLLLIPVIALISSCKEQGEPFIKWRNFTAQNMINRYNAITEIRAMKDSVLMRGITEAIIQFEMTYRDTSIKLLTIGFCYSTTNNNPILKATYIPNDSLENAIYINILNNSIMDTLGGVIHQYSKNATLNFGLTPLKIDQEYYARSFIIFENTQTNKIDTAYNSVVSKFRTRVPEDYWFHKPSFPQIGRTEAVCFVVKNVAFIGCGYNGTTLLSDFWKYDPHGGVGGNGSWQQISTPGSNFQKRMSAVAIPIENDTVLVGLGIINQATKEATGYFRKLAINFLANEYNWNTPQVDSFPSPRYDAVGFSLYVTNTGTGTPETRAYVLGGRYRASFLNDMMYYDRNSDNHGVGPKLAWKSQLNYGGGNVTEAVVTTINNVAIVGSGRDTNGIKNSFWKFDPNSGQPNEGTWSPLSTFPGTPRTNAVAITLEYIKNNLTYKHIYFGTGKTSTGQYLNDWWMYDFLQDKWIQKSYIIDYTNPNRPDTAAAREGAIAFTIKKQHVEYGTLERGFVGLGQSKTTKLNDLWEYLP